MYYKIFLTTILYSNLALGFTTPSDDNVNQWVNLALNINTDKLEVVEGRDYFCGPMQLEGQPLFRSYGNSFDMAQARAGLKCIRYQCDSLAGKVTNKIDSFRTKEGHKFLREHLSSINEESDFEEILHSIDEYQVGKSVNVSCTNSQIARYLAYDSCFGLPTICEKVKKQGFFERLFSEGE